jgi:hypothetical protein
MRSVMYVSALAIICVGLLFLVAAAFGWRVSSLTPLSFSRRLSVAVTTNASTSADPPQSSVDTASSRLDRFETLLGEWPSSVDSIAMLLKSMSPTEQCDALALATHYSKLELVEQLVASGVHPECVGTGGLSAIHLANDREIIEWFVSKGVSINCADSDKGMSPIWYAISRRDVVTVEYLLSRGDVDLCLKSKQGLSIDSFLQVWRNRTAEEERVLGRLREKASHCQ